MAMEKYKILNKDFYVNFVNDNCADDGIIKNNLKKSSTKLLIRRLIEKNENTDLQIKIGEWAISCHLIVLQCYSEFFKHLNIGYKRIVELPNEQVSPTTFTKIYEWMIIDEPTIQREEIVELFISAYYLGINELVQQIWSCLSDEEHINEHEAYLLYYEASLADVKCLKEIMLKRISRFFLILVAFREFLYMSVEDLCCLLSSDDIGVNTEIEVFMSCLRWLSYKWTNRKKYLLKVMQSVRFGLLPPGFLIELDRDMINNALIKSVMRRQQVRKLVMDGLKLATTQFCYGNCNSLRHRKWLYDEKCGYHLKANQLIEYKITYEQFLGYLHFLQKCNKDHWRAYVYIKTESQTILNHIDLRQLQLFNEPSQACIVKETTETEYSYQPSLATSSATFRIENSTNHSSGFVNPRSNTTAFEKPSEIYSNISQESEHTSDQSLKNEKNILDKAFKHTGHNLFKKFAYECNSAQSSSSQSWILFNSNSINKKFLDEKPICSTQKIEENPTKLKCSVDEEFLNNVFDKKKKSLNETLSVPQTQSTDNEDDLSITVASVSDYISSSEENCFEDEDEFGFNTSFSSDAPLRQKTHANSIIKKEVPYTKAPPDMVLKIPKAPNPDEKEKSDIEPVVLFKRPKQSRSETATARTFILTKENIKRKVDKSKSSETDVSITINQAPLKEKKAFKSLFKNKTLLILGGTDPYSQSSEKIAAKQRSSFVDKVLLYNDKLKQWAQLPHTAFGTRHHHAAVICNGLVFIIGGTKVIPGCKKAFFETSIWCFNPKSKTWAFETNLPQNRRDFAVIAVEGRENEAGIILIGGESFDRAALNSVWLYKLNEKVWERKASLNIGRYGFAATVVKNEIWIAGGIAYSSSTITDKAGGDATPKTFTEFITDTIEYYSLENIFDKKCKGKWIEASNRLRRPCLYGKFCATHTNELLLVGGFGLDAEKTLNSFDSIDNFSIESKQWTQCATLKYARHGHDIVLIDDYIAIIGGVSSKLKCALQSIEMFSTKTKQVFNLLPELPWPLSGLAAVTVRGEY